MNESTNEDCDEPIVANDHVADGLSVASDDHVTNDLVVRTDLQGNGRTSTTAEPTRAPLDVRRVDDPAGVIVILTGELDLVTAPLLQRRLRSAALSSGTVVIDLAGLRFIDSSGLNVLVRTQQWLLASGGRLVLVGAPRAVRRAFELMGLEGRFEWRKSRSAALYAEPEPRGGRRS